MATEAADEEQKSKIPDNYVPVTEGRATIVFPKDNEVFYNPVQQFNRDLSLCAIRAWMKMWKSEVSTKFTNSNKSKKRKLENGDGEAEQTHAGASGISILEALSATGLRAIRYAKEIPEAKEVIANDMDANAVHEINRNIEINQAGDRVKATHEDAMVTMYLAKARKKRFHVVDLDPYGTASPFIDGAVQSVVDGGLLCITCTDLAILAGNGYPEKCFSLYGGISTRANYCHELALRLVLNTIATSAARYGRSIEPMLCLSVDFYVRLFVRVRSSPAQVKFNHSKTMTTYQCTGCGSWQNQPVGRTIRKSPTNVKHTSAPGPPVDKHCAHCGFKHHIIGPCWSGPLHNVEFIQNILGLLPDKSTDSIGTKDRIKGMLTVAAEELEEPFYWSPPELFSTVKASCPPWTQIASALLNAGYQVSASHAMRGSLKTNAPPAFMWDVARSWTNEHPVKMESFSEGSPGKAILGKPITHDIHWDENPKAKLPSRQIKLTRYQSNPTANWGPMARAGKGGSVAKKS